MENFVVSARKYRPITFESVVGQQNITKTLKNAIKSSQLAHAYLFCGPRGVGKTTCARILAKTINCQHLTADFEPCGECEPCKSFNTNASFNIFELDAASNNSVHDIRSLVEQVRIPPQVGKYKIYILDEVHMLSTEAFNAFLKTLEEPPAYAVFILATTEKHKVLPTILSRCQIFDFKRISNEDIVAHLEYVAGNEGITYESEALHIIAQKADGGMRDSLSMFDQLASFTGRNLTYQRVIENLNVLDYDYYFKLADFIYAGNYSSAFMLFDRVLDAGFDGQFFLSGFSAHLRNILISTDSITVKLIEGSDVLKARYSEQATRIGQVMIMKYLDICNSADISYRTSNNKRLHVELTLLKMSSITIITADASSSQHDGAVNYQKPNTLSATNTVQPQQVANTSISPQPVAVTNQPQSDGKTTKQEDTTVAEVQQVKVEIPSFKTKSVTSFSIKEAQEEIKKKTDVVVEQEVSALTNQRIGEVWKSFARKDWLEPKYVTILETHAPKLDGETRINFDIDGMINDNIFNDIKTELLQHIRKELGNNAVTLNINVVIPEETASKPYSNPDKYEFLAQKNPVISELKSAFSLNTDY